MVSISKRWAGRWAASVTCVNSKLWSNLTIRDLSIFYAFLLAAYAAAQTGGKAPARFVITDFGAIADAKTVNTKAIQSAIDKCAASGGGVVVVPKGTFVSGAIFLKQGANLYVEKDGVLNLKSEVER
jgi:hypothetical protein